MHCGSSRPATQVSSKQIAMPTARRKREPCDADPDRQARRYPSRCVGAEARQSATTGANGVASQRSPLLAKRDCNGIASFRPGNLCCNCGSTRAQLMQVKSYHTVGYGSGAVRCCKLPRYTRSSAGSTPSTQSEMMRWGRVIWIGCMSCRPRSPKQPSKCWQPKW
jgi:hypothetical protein